MKGYTMQNSESFIPIVIGLLIIIAGILFIRIPICMAKARKISGGELTVIACLSWATLITGVTWFIAIGLVLLYQPGKWIDKDKGTTNANLQGLNQLNQLRKDSVLSETEFQREKKKLMGHADEDEQAEIDEEKGFEILEQLHEMKKKGLLTEAEYQKERKKVFYSLTGAEKSTSTDSSIKKVATKKRKS